LGTCFSDWKAFLVNQHAGAPACETLTRGMATAFASGKFRAASCVSAEARCPDLGNTIDLAN